MPEPYLIRFWYPGLGVYNPIMLNSKIEKFLNEARGFEDKVWLNLQGYPFFFNLMKYEAVTFESISQNPTHRTVAGIWELADFEAKGFDVQTGLLLLSRCNYLKTWKHSEQIQHLKYLYSAIENYIRQNFSATFIIIKK